MKIRSFADLSVFRKLEKAGKPVMAAGGRGMLRWALGVHREIIQNLTGKKLKVRTGRLRSRQQPPRVERKGWKLAAVFENKVVYARIHEYGGKTKPHDIVPKHKKVLRFMVGGKAVFARKVRHPGSRMKERRFIRDPIKRNFPKLARFMDPEIRRVLDGK